MKQLIASFFFLGSISIGLSQGSGNFFFQSETDIRYMSDQIAALKTYSDFATRGYEIAHNGLVIIGDIKKGELDLHNIFFRSLSTVNPNIRSYTKVGDIITCVEYIITAFKKTTGAKGLSGPEMNYLKMVYSNMADDCTKSLDALTNLITNNQYQLYDNERIEGIDAIYSDILERYAFTRAFLKEADLFSNKRTTVWNQIK